MADSFDARQFQARLERLDGLLREAERCGDPTAQDQSRALVQAVLDLHAAALQRLLRHVMDAGEAGAAILDACVQDEVVGGLMLLHGLHPLDVEERVQQALEGVRPYLHSHGGNVESVEVGKGVVRLRLQGSCHSCPSSAVTMRQTIEEAIYAKAPEVTTVEVDTEMETALRIDDRERRLALPLV